MTLGAAASEAIGAGLFADEKRPVEMRVPVELAVLQGGFSFVDPDNPFLIGLEQGGEALARCYEAYAPEDLGAMYGLERTGRAGEELPPWELPWLNRSASRRPPPGECGLGPEHGVSYYGPVSPEKVGLELRRLREVRDSIEQSGFRPTSRTGYLNGQLLVSGDEYRFLVRGGKHRAAALAALGHTHLPVRFRPTWPRVVDRRDLACWTLVVSGEVDAEVAGEIFDTYFSAPGRTRSHPSAVERTVR